MGEEDALSDPSVDPLEVLRHDTAGVNCQRARLLSSFQLSMLKHRRGSRALALSESMW